MNGIGAYVFSRHNDAIHIQVAVFCRTFTDADSLVRQLHMQAVRVFFGIDGNASDAHIAAGTGYTNCNFAAIGNQDLVKHSSPSLL